MRRKEREITDPGEIEEIIGQAEVCRVGLVDGDEPYIVPVFFGYEKGAIYFHCALEGRKIEIIKRHNRACFEIDTDVEIVGGQKPCGWTARYRSIMGVGRARILEDETEKVHALNVLMKQYSKGDSNFDSDKLDAVLMVRIDIESMTGKKSGY
jgi:nitroimidazol reductase NimA-like FMN-containing flavoprotein (pyridoxamine 5'-phosphate oxidase superfamily)